eukprot:TRINITY_DN5187_c0_g1_i1.p7 TRINITY_DN5187_c0_g1~~TRINITY_DN5187_c0_g1_i1.p7  ORF type:complete len:101 (+),score=19.56 TRINITY_DN5187_c0_g1_i1:733-1035(+)
MGAGGGGSAPPPHPRPRAITTAAVGSNRRGGDWGGDGAAGAIVRPTNPMTRDPAFVRALAQGEGVGAGWPGAVHGAVAATGRCPDGGDGWVDGLTHEERA